MYKAERKKLLHALSAITSLMPSANIIPILDNAVLSDENSIRGGSLERSIIFKEVFFEVGKQSICVNAKHLKDFCSVVKGDVISINNGKISDGVSLLEIPFVSPDEYPVFTANNDTYDISIEVIKSISEKCSSFCVGPDDLRVAMQGIGFDTTHAFATNGLAVFSYEHNSNTPDLIVPPSVLKLAVQYADSDTIKIGSNVILSECIEINFMPLEARPIPWRRVFPSEQPHKSEMNRLDLISAIKSARIGEDITTRLITINFQFDGLVIEGKDELNQKSSSTSVKAISSFELLIGVNSNLLLSILNGISSDFITLEYSEPNKVITIDNGKELALIAPMLL